ncbi:hypothetical protein McpSp1_13520 [Methanocorpusculaceae archaeon Sp1]|nr:hypothetical protein [Methanocorpusculaceae archaeon Sp1]
MDKRYLLVPLLFFVIISSGCITQEPVNGSLYQPLDYSLAENWVMVPNASAEQKAVDVFYLYPTLATNLYVDSMNLSDPAARDRAVVNVMTNKGVYEETANVYAPYYRQTGLYSMIGNGTWTEDQYVAGQLAYEDAKAAFLYYLENYNDGKPFILAGHSQGSYRIKQLMIDLFVDPELQGKLVAAYPIGYTVSEFELAQYGQLKPATGELDTGVIITYHTQAPELSGENVVVLPGSIGINPLNWKTDGTYASADENYGAVFFENGSVSSRVANFTGAYLAEVDGSIVLIADSPDPAVYSTPELFAEGVFHTNDYAFFYENLKENVAKRTAAYLEKNGV